MRALVVYESMYGNTRRIADAVADGIAGYMTVETVEVSTAPNVLEFDVDLLVVGGPTHVHGMTSPYTRAQAIKQATNHIVSPGLGMREWLAHLRPITPPIPAAAFDTRIKSAAILTGSAAHGYVKRLRGAGFRVVAPAESFFIATNAPQDDALLDGEIDHARAWGGDVARQITGKLAVPVA